MYSVRVYCTVTECTVQCWHVLYSDGVYCTVTECTVQYKPVLYSVRMYCQGFILEGTLQWNCVKWDIAAVMTMWQWGLHNFHCMGPRPIHFIRNVRVSVCLCCCDNPKNPLPGVLETSVLSWDSHEIVMRQSWDSHETVMRQSTTLLQLQALQTCLFLSVQLDVSHPPTGWPHDHGLPFRQRPW